MPEMRRLTVARIDQRHWGQGPSLLETDYSRGDLLKRIERECLARHIALEVIELERLDIPAVQPADRIIFCSHTRSDYPQQAIEQLIQAELGIPWGIVTGAWHWGSRRSGIGVTAHWMQPWYRWWESWYGWLFPQWARPASLCVTQFEPVTLPTDLAMVERWESTFQQQPSAARSMTIACACKLTSDTWLQVAERAGLTVTARRSWDELCDSADCPDYFLWDDSWLACLPGVPIESQLLQQWARLRERLPESRLLASLNIGHLDLWPVLSQAGCEEIFIKPSHGLPLADYLHHQSSQAAG